MLVQDFLHYSVDRLPEKTALVAEAGRFTYADIESMSNRLAHALLAHGLNRGDRVVIHYPNSLETVVAIFAVLKAGGVFVVVNPATRPEKLAYIANNCQTAAVLVSGRKPGLLDTLLPAVPSLKFAVLAGSKKPAVQPPGIPSLTFDAIQSAFPDHRPPTRNIDLDLACLIYTSGSTGEPKGVMSDHSNVVFAASAIIEYLQNVESDIVLNVLPLSFDYGLYQLLMTFKFGGTLVLERSFAFPASVLERLQAERVTGFPGVPTIFAVLLQMDLSGYDFSSLRYLTNTGAALSPHHIARLREKFPSATIYSMYGLTETKRTLYLPPDQLQTRPDSVGIPIPGTEVWLEDEAGNRLGPGQVGELIVRGRHVMRGYWNNPEATARRFRPGPLPGERVCCTGDLFRMDEDGYFYFVSRKDDIIKSRGEKVAPREIENTVYRLDGVVEAAAIGVPDPILGEAIRLFIVAATPDLTEAKVRAHCRRYLEDFMLPRYVEFWPALPKNSSGKIDRIALKKCAESPELST
ncbi:MAG: AMP-dependent synthetase [Chloroflexi bacterium]|nr:MAG: AMP-dependent synthetase [Chloroflexota bacterium]